MRRAMVGFVAIGVVGLVVAAGWADGPKPTPIKQTWASTGASFAETESLAACRLKSGEVRLFATCKSGHRVDIFDAATGKFLRSLGKKGKGIGEFDFPNGIAVSYLKRRHGESMPVLAVVERDNARVQLFDPETLNSIGVIGEKDLGQPYGLAFSYYGGQTTLYVTDEKPRDGHRIRAYRVTVAEISIESRCTLSFGDTDGPGEIKEAESIVADDASGLLFACDEKADDVKVYTLEGKFTGKIIGKGLIKDDPEGIVIIQKPERTLLVTEQRKDLTIWHTFDCKTHQHLGSFTGEPNIANTDGICILEEPFGPFKAGALFAVNRDEDVRAYPLEAFAGSGAAHASSSGEPE